MSDLKKIQAKLDKPSDVIYLSDREITSVIGFFPEEYRKAALKESRNRHKKN